MAPDDPRTDQSGTPGKSVPDVQRGTPQKAPGGVGTGTPKDPAKEPAAQPPKK